MVAKNLQNPHDAKLKPSRLPRLIQWAMVAWFVLGVGVSGVYALTEHWRRATFVLGAALLWLAVVRWLCDSQVLGVLAVRSRRFDLTFSTLLGVAMVFLASSVDSLGS